MKKLERENRICERDGCGAVFVAIKKEKRKYCSHKCALFCNNKKKIIPLEIRLCACGCGGQIEVKQTSKRKYIKGHQNIGRTLPCSKERAEKISKALCGIKRSEESKLKNRLAHLGKKASEETKKKMSISSRHYNPMKGKNISEEAKKKISCSLKGRVLSKEHKENLSKAITGIKRSEETKKKISSASKKVWQNDSFRKMMSEKLTGRSSSKKGKPGVKLSQETKNRLSKISKNNWKNPDYVKKVFSGTRNSPNRAELKLFSLLNQACPNEYKFVGNGGIIIGTKIPDFININGQKKIIELFGDYWHSEEVVGRPAEEEEKQRIEIFQRYGYKTLIVWEKELSCEEKLCQKMKEFHNG